MPWTFVSADDAPTKRCLLLEPTDRFELETSLSFADHRLTAPTAQQSLHFALGPPPSVTDTRRRFAQVSEISLQTWLGRHTAERRGGPCPDIDSASDSD